MITADGWIEHPRVIKLPGRKPVFDGKSGFNPGRNGMKGLVFHSAEGWAQTMLDPKSQWGYYNAEFPYHFSNLLDGRLYQHYSMTLRCWHGSAFNQDYNGIEHEGVSKEAGKGPLLNDMQIDNDRFLISECEAAGLWTARRPAKVGDLTASLYEHKETVWFGGTSTSCPNNRIPWDKILQPAQEDDMANLTPDGAFKIVVENNCIVFYSQNIPVFKIGDDAGPYAGRIAKNFGGQWVFLRNPGDADGKAEAYWSNEPGD